MTRKPLPSSASVLRPLQKPLATAVAAACGVSSAVLVAPPALAQQALEEIVVTATRREETTQDIPMAISVLGGQQLEDLNITDMQDYIEMLPNVSYVTLGPGSGNVYIRVVRVPHRNLHHCLPITIQIKVIAGYVSRELAVQ